MRYTLFFFILLTLAFVGCGTTGYVVDDETLGYEFTHAVNIVRVRHMQFTDSTSDFRVYYAWHSPAYFWYYTDATKKNVDTYMKVIDVLGHVIIVRGGISDYVAINIGNDHTEFVSALQEVREYIILDGQMGAMSPHNPNMEGRGLREIDK